jgi:hypothetical protein
MSLTAWKDLAGVVESIVTVCAILVGGWWTYFRFIKQRENHALIDFTVDIVFHEFKNGYWIVELVAFLENKGKVQHRVSDFKFEVESLNNGDQVLLNEAFGNQVYFPNAIVSGSFLPAKSTYFFNEPGLKNKYSFIARIPQEADVILMHSTFRYLDGKHFHSAEVTKRVPKPNTTT